MAVRLPEAFGADGIFDLAAERKSRSTVEAKHTGPPRRPFSSWASTKARLPLLRALR
jgi:hypothetical protein